MWHICVYIMYMLVRTSILDVCLSVFCYMCHCSVYYNVDNDFHSGTSLSPIWAKPYLVLLMDVFGECVSVCSDEKKLHANLMVWQIIVELFHFVRCSIRGSLRLNVFPFSYAQNAFVFIGNWIWHVELWQTMVSEHRTYTYGVLAYNTSIYTINRLHTII